MEYNFRIEPGAFNAFADESALMEQCKAWGLLSDKAIKTKAFVYKRGGVVTPCTIVGFVDEMTAVIAFDHAQRHCIHPSLLKEMQAANYGLKASAAADQASTETDIGEAAPLEEPVFALEDAVKAAGNKDTPAFAGGTGEDASIAAAAPGEQAAAGLPAHKAAVADKPLGEQPGPAKEKPARKKSAKLQLPEEKVKMTAIVKEFTTVPNHFADEDDEVVIYENVAIIEPELELGDAWSSLSATLKKFELEVGDTITFEAKVVAKKLTKHPVPYKINNPSKINKV